MSYSAYFLLLPMTLGTKLIGKIVERELVTKQLSVLTELFIIIILSL